ncbi:ArsO family NAD(P)H-dependent flavin-containing monooxygenase [Corynebacterium halotolerans]|uniref:Oxidoreductase n=1 Tax=Corynebacterium halotolerans YIM 70093 = DSM 44683 TaxID=1121362 RepID=M1P1P9_9CORY|nr:ArsO family NAD(P)H-dependent flavin-containing monooxygenase [Corynebacterium halotolerans]AGF73740.1 oxidoreductase [Corynebacterium halotolerans YIM 70093 = DSM 44683]
MSESTPAGHHEAIIIGAGQAGLATAYYLRRAGVDFLILDNQTAPGGAWQQYWPSLALFSTSDFSSLPGRQMPPHEGYPPASHVVDYFTRYEQRYDLPVERPVDVTAVEHDGERYIVRAGDRFWTADNIVAATGIWSSPYVPSYPGTITGAFWHSANYPGPETFRGQKVAVIGGGNSGAQISAELSEVADVTWYTLREPRWMPDDVDGRELFRRNRQRALAIQRGEEDPGADSELGDIVMVPEVRRARDEGRLKATPMVGSLDEIDADHLIWCTGYLPALGPFEDLLDGREPRQPGLYLVGYGDWTGPGSATIVGVSPYARDTAARIAESLGKPRK